MEMQGAAVASELVAAPASEPAAEPNEPEAEPVDTAAQANEQAASSEEAAPATDHERAPGPRFLMRRGLESACKVSLLSPRTLACTR